MNQQEIIEFNRNCAEFMGWKEKRDILNLGDEESMFFQTPFNREYWSRGTSITREGWEQTELFTPKDMLFYEDWNWIMEVVDKIYSLDVYYDEYIEFNSCMITDGKIKISTKKEAVVQAINQFLTWYNANK